MASIAELFYYAETHNIIVDDTFEFDKTLAASCALDDGIYIIGLHKSLYGKAYREQLAHEIGHCATNSFYNEETPCVTRGRCEQRAYTWQVHTLVPIRSLKAALKKGCNEVWMLAEYFNVSEDLIRKAIEIYKQEGKLPM